MYVVQISDREVFIKKAQGLTVEVTAVATVQPGEVKGGYVLMDPGMSLYYSIEFEDPKLGPSRWTFAEFLRADEQSRVSTADTLLTALRSNPLQLIRVRRRSGSIDV